MLYQSISNVQPSGTKTSENLLPFSQLPPIEFQPDNLIIDDHGFQKFLEPNVLFKINEKGDIEKIDK